MAQIVSYPTSVLRAAAKPALKCADAAPDNRTAGVPPAFF